MASGFSRTRAPSFDVASGLLTAEALAKEVSRTRGRYAPGDATASTATAPAAPLIDTRFRKSWKGDAAALTTAARDR